MQQTGREWLRISRVELFRYPGARDRSRDLNPSYGLLMRLRADDGVTAGIGEAVVGPRDADGAWRELERLADDLQGRVLPTDVDWSRPFARLGKLFVRRIRRLGNAAQLAVELALLDMMMTARGRSPSDLGNRAGAGDWSRVQPLLRLPKTEPAENAGADWLSAVEGTSDAVRVQSTGNPATDLKWLRELADLDRKVGGARPLWLVGRHNLTQQAAVGLVEDIAKLQLSGELPPRVLFEEPLRKSDIAELCRLQAVADQMTGSGSLTTTGPRVSIVAHVDASSAARLSKLRGGRSIGGVCLSPAGSGTWLGVRAMANEVKQRNPSTSVFLMDSAEGSDISGAALELLAQTTPEIDMLVSPRTGARWLNLLAGAPDPGHPGMFPGFDIAPLAAAADRLSERPHAVFSAAVRPNTYTEDLAPGAPLGVPKQTISEAEALRFGLRTRRSSRTFFLAEDETSKGVIGFRGPQSSGVSIPGATIARHKGFTRDMLAAQGLPIAPGGWFRSGELDKARALARELGFPLVVKPVDGLQGRGVTTNITSIEQLEQAFLEVAESGFGSAGIVVEKMVGGNDYRVLATPKEVISVVRRDPASVIGDGIHSVEELVLAANVTRRLNPYLGRHLIKLDNRADALLDGQGLTRRSVPAAGQYVRLSAVANLSQGGQSTEVTESTHPSVADLGIAAVAAIPGIPYGGVDIYLADHTRPVEEQTATIIEINHNPALMLHHYPMFGPPRNVCRRLIEELASSAGLTLAPQRDTLTIRLTVTGDVQRVGYRRWMARAAQQLGLDGWVRNSTSPDEVEAVVHGPVSRVRVMLRLAFTGPSKARPIETYAVPIDQTPRRGFRILETGEPDAS